MQGLLVVIAAGLLLVAGYQWGRSEDASASGSPSPSAMQVVALALLGTASFAGAISLQGRGGIRIPTPARLDELAGRAEKVAIERAEQAAAEKPSS